MSSSPRTLPAVLRAAAETHGDQPAYVEGERTLTYRDLLHRVRETAAGYRSLGLGTGDRVVVWAPNSIDWAVAALAVSYAGGVLVPANSRYTGHEVADIVDRTGARLVVVADGFLGRTQIADLRAAGDLSSVIRVIDIADLAQVSADPADIDEVADRAGGRRRRRHPVHLGHDRTPEGRDERPPADDRRRRRVGQPRRRRAPRTATSW